MSDVETIDVTTNKDELPTAAVTETNNPVDEDDADPGSTAVPMEIARGCDGKQYKQQRQKELDELRKKRLAQKLREGLAHGAWSLFANELLH